MKVIVKENRVVVHGHRRFQDRVDASDGGKVSTENYQTFREEIPLERPVHEKLALRSWENGVLTVKSRRPDPSGGTRCLISAGSESEPH
ncbi:MAG: Hsp20/alpha crystallin family protein [Calothrix sp. SM1_5_4]|nr:Hsp20/alpha crystallin family protein [Calothrix sp. SM1_5_4]